MITRHDTRDGDVLSETFGDYLRNQRKRSGFTQRELADKVGIDFTYISKLENNAAPVPSIQTLRRMADAFHITDAQMCAAAGRLVSDLSKQELERYALQLLKVHENTMEENRALQQQLDAAEQRAERMQAFLLELNRERYSLPRTISDVAREPEDERKFSLDYWRGQMAILEWAIDDTAPHYGFTLTEQEPTDA